MQALDPRPRIGVLILVATALLACAPDGFAADKPTLRPAAPKPAAPAEPSPPADAQVKPENPATPSVPASPAPPSAPVQPAAPSVKPATRPSTGSTPTPVDRTPRSTPAKTPTLAPATGSATPATPSNPPLAAPSTPHVSPPSSPPKLATPVETPSPAPRHAGQPAGTTHPAQPSPRGGQPVETPPVERAPAEPPQTSTSPIRPRPAQPVDTPRAPIAEPTVGIPAHTGLPTASPRPPGWTRWPDGGGPAGGPPVIVRVHPRRGHHGFPWCGGGCPPCGPGIWPAAIPTLVIVESAHLSGQEEYSEIVYACAPGLARIDHPNGTVLLDERAGRVSFYDRESDRWSDQPLEDWVASVDSIVGWTHGHSRPDSVSFEASGDSVLVAGFECAAYRVSLEVDDGDRVMQIAQAVWVTQDVEVTPEIYATYRNMQRLFDDQWLDVCAERPQGFVFRTRGVRLPVPLEEGESAEIAEASVVDVGYRLYPLSFFQNPTWVKTPVLTETHFPR